jgi:hypothetical protein
MHRRLGRSQAQSGRVRKNSPQPEFDPWIPATSELLYRLRTAVHRITYSGPRNYVQRSAEYRKGKRKYAVEAENYVQRSTEYRKGKRKYSVEAENYVQRSTEYRKGKRKYAVEAENYVQRSTEYRKGKESMQWKQRIKKIKYKERKWRRNSSLAIRVTDIIYCLLHYM